MISNDKNQISLIDETVNTLDGNIDTTTGTEGLSLIDKWLNHLNDAGTDETQAILDTLELLRPEIDTAQRYNRPDNQRIAELLEQLVSQTRAVAGKPEASAEQTELAQLIAVLENLHQQAAGLTA
ncbi:hypothetical protein [Spirosoma rhododendri]|uniref:Uncharacterized protein n=1 Tax=Spirosoma rhododendri TaxID=2728024 RepID=A0A7L5DRM2_9BACT|nr:hypothetical protein [Spirosoma rhododendri]QJD80252.1 hypothetical protein HH216_18880 [Spirosoma rhododendri]